MQWSLSMSNTRLNVIQENCDKKKNLFELPILSDYNLHFYHEKDK